MKVSLQSKDKEDIELFFTLLSKKITIDPIDFESKEEFHFMFKLNFRELQKCVTNKRENVTSKQNLSVNKELIGRIGLYRNSGLSFQKIADKLNAEGFRNSRNNKLNRMQVLRLHKEYEKEAKEKM